MHAHRSSYHSVIFRHLFFRLHCRHGQAHTTVLVYRRRAIPNQEGSEKLDQTLLERDRCSVLVQVDGCRVSRASDFCTVQNSRAVVPLAHPGLDRCLRGLKCAIRFEPSTL